MIILPGPASRKLGIEIAKYLKKAKVASLVFKEFPDGESYIRIDEKLNEETVLIIQSTYPPQDYHLMQLFQLIDAAHESRAKKIAVFVPYLAYARQDKKFLNGEPTSSKIICKTIENLGADEFYVFDIHSEKILDFFTIPAHNLLPIRLFAEYFQRKSLYNPFILAPDSGAQKKAQMLSKLINTSYTGLLKKRDYYTGLVTTQFKEIDIKNRDVILIDDIICTGDAMMNTIQIIKKQGCNRIFATCSHPLLIGNAKERILKAGATDIIGTNSIDSEFSKISIVPTFIKEFTG